MAEIRPISFAPGYFVSDDGHVFSGKRGQWKRLAPTPRGKYLAVSLYTGGRQLLTGIHVVVCRAFHGDPHEGQEVRHLDGKRHNNRADNLAWGTRSEIMADKIRHGTSQIGSRNPNSALTEADVIAIKGALAAGETQTSIATRYGVTQANISAIHKGLTWTHVRTDAA